MMYSCVIIDDEELARNLIENHLSQLDNFRLVAACGSAIEASKVLKNESVDLLFLDIEMPVLRGTDFFKNLIHKPKVIFTTAYRDYALDGFELNAVDYLLKPISFGRFFKAVEKFLEQQKPPPTTPLPSTKAPNAAEYVFIRKDRKRIKVFFKDIQYIESVKDYIKIVTSSENHLIKHSISAFEEQLDERFVRTHRSYIVNFEKITAYTKQDVEIGALEIPIGDSYKTNVQKRLES